MQVTGYQRAVDLKPMQTPEVKASKDLTAYGGNQFGANMMADAMGKALDVSMKIAEEKMVTDVTAASAEYNKRMTDDLLKLQSENKLGNADGLTEKIAEISKKHQADVMKMVPNYRKAQTALDMSINRDSQEYYKNMARYQSAQLDENKVYVTDNNISAISQKAILNLSPESVAGGIGEISTTIAANFANRGKDYVESMTRKQVGNFVAGAIMSASDTGNDQLARKLMDENKEFLTAEQFWKINSTLYNKGKVDTLSAITNKAMQANVKTYAEARKFVEEHGVISGHDGPTFNMPVQGGIDYDNVRPELKSALPAVGGMLGDLGKIASISSGYRDPERNRNAGGAEGSYHLKGDAVDIAFERNLTPVEVEQIKQKFGAHFEEVLFHDAGSGNHLHLGGYKNTLGSVSKSRPMNSAEKEEAVKSIMSRVNANEQDEVRLNHQTTKDVNSAAWEIYQANPNNVAAYDELLKNYSSNNAQFMAAQQALAYWKSVAPINRKDSDIDAEISLNKAISNDALTIEMVQALANSGKLSPKDVVKYSTAANDNIIKTVKSADQQTDKMLYIMAKDKVSGKDGDILGINVQKQLDMAGLKGQERYDRGVKLIADHKANTLFSAANNIQYYTIKERYGPDLVKLVNSGYMTKGGVDQSEVNKFLTDIGSAIKSGDRAADATIGYMIKRGSPINRELYNRLYSEIAKGYMYRGEPVVITPGPQPQLAASIPTIEDFDNIVSSPNFSGYYSD